MPREGFLQRIQRAGADIAEHDADRSDCQPRGPLGSKGRRMGFGAGIGGRRRSANVRH